MMLRTFSWIVGCALGALGCASAPAEPAESAPVTVAIPELDAIPSGPTTTSPPPPGAELEPSPIDDEAAEAADAERAVRELEQQRLIEQLATSGALTPVGLPLGTGGQAGLGVPGPAVQSTPAAAGSIDREVVRAGVRAGMASIKACYEQRLAAKPELRGRAVMRFVIAPSGAVAKASVEQSSLADPELERCLERAVTRLQFPARTAGPAIVNYPFVFEPGS